MIKQDKNNFRVHSEENKALIKKSVDELGAGRSIVIDGENNIVAGNATFEAWGDKPIKVIETAGEELIVVKRTDLKTSDKKRKLLALADNQTSDLSEFNMELVEDEFPEDELMEWGFEIEEESEQKDLSNELNGTFEVIITCENEREQETIYNKLIEENYTCRVLTL